MGIRADHRQVPGACLDCPGCCFLRGPQRPRSSEGQHVVFFKCTLCHIARGRCILTICFNSFSPNGECRKQDSGGCSRTPQSEGHRVRSLQSFSSWYCARHLARAAPPPTIVQHCDGTSGVLQALVRGDICSVRVRWLAFIFHRPSVNWLLLSTFHQRGNGTQFHGAKPLKVTSVGSFMLRINHILFVHSPADGHLGGCGRWHFQAKLL